MDRVAWLPWLCLCGAAWGCASGAEQGAGPSAPGTIAELPGAPPLSPELQAELTRALAAKGPGYVPRTRHLDEDGSPKYTNRLIRESSPYLIQHAHNPVNWYPWGDEAFEEARRLGRPVLLSVGYSTCHWCHVMEKESFEDEEIARVINESYIPIKVDREERPDVDSIYMAAVQAVTGGGGWPMTVWLTPDRKPFYGGTYFPPRDGDRGARAGFLTYLKELRKQYDEQPERIASLGDQITGRIKQQLALAAPGTDLPGVEVIESTVRPFAQRFDPENGGTKGTRKFPSDFPNRLLLREYVRTGDSEYLDMVTRTLERMAAGGIHDQVGGGFHRYAVDGAWLVPHFEKMLYDNAQLAVVYLEAYQATGRTDFAEVARGILRYVSAEMTAPEGGFYSATDADSPAPEGPAEEGRFFTWTPAEIRGAVGEEGAPVVEAYFGITQSGNFEGRNVLHRARSIDDVAQQLGIPPARVRAILPQAIDRMYRARLLRPAPLRDEKILTSWNGLMISAFATGGRVLSDPSFVTQAEKAADFVLTRMRQEDGRLRHSLTGGRAYLDDYAFFIAGLLDLYEATFDPRWIREAIALQKTLEAHYRDAGGGGYFRTSDDHEALLSREKPAFDGAEPSGNSIALMNLARLDELTGDDRYRAAADALLKSFGPTLSRAGGGATDLLLALAFRLAKPKEIVIVTAGPKSEAEHFLAALRKAFSPNHVLVVTSQGPDLAEQSKEIPMLEGKVARGAKATAYVCQSGVCKLPTTEVEAFMEQVRAKSPTATEALTLDPQGK
jgi:uncharacterized protein YyaL (SSP411 family)